MSLDLTDDRSSTLVHVMAWCRQAASHYMYLSKGWHRSLSPYGIKWVNTTCDLLWHKSRSTLAHAISMISYYLLNNCGVIISKASWHSSEVIIIRRYEDTSCKARLKITILKLYPDLPGTNEFSLTNQPRSISSFTSFSSITRRFTKELDYRHKHTMKCKLASSKRRYIFLYLSHYIFVTLTWPPPTENPMNVVLGEIFVRNSVSTYSCCVKRV